MNTTKKSLLPLVMFETNIIFDYFLGRDADVLLLSKLSQKQIEIKIPDFVLMEFRGSILKELGKKEYKLSFVRQLANELDRADKWNNGTDSLRKGCELVAKDIDHLRSSVDVFIGEIRKQFTVETHSAEIHYKGDLRYVKGLPPAEPERGIQDCRVLEAILEIGRADAENNNRERFFLTKDSDFNKGSVKEELRAFGIEIVNSAGYLYGRFVAP